MSIYMSSYKFSTIVKSPLKTKEVFFFLPFLLFYFSFFLSDGPTFFFCALARGIRVFAESTQNVLSIVFRIFAWEAFKRVRDDSSTFELNRNINLTGRSFWFHLLPCCNFINRDYVLDRVAPMALNHFRIWSVYLLREETSVHRNNFETIESITFDRKNFFINYFNRDK